MASRTSFSHTKSEMRTSAAGLGGGSCPPQPQDGAVGQEATRGQGADFGACLAERKRSTISAVAPAGTCGRADADGAASRRMPRSARYRSTAAAMAWRSALTGCAAPAGGTV